MVNRKMLVGALVIAAGAAVLFAADAGATMFDPEAPKRVGTWDWGVLGGGAFNEAHDDTLYVQTQIAYGLTPWLAVGGETGYQESMGQFNDESVGIVQIMGDILLRVPTVHDAIVPYAVVGLGGLGAWVEDTDGVAPDNNGGDVSDVAFGWKLGGGVDIFFDKHWVGCFEGAYFDGANELPGSSVEDNIQFFTFAAGIKYVD